jgi:hypothetical protein
MPDSPILHAIARAKFAAESTQPDDGVNRMLRELRMAEADLRAALDAVDVATDDSSRFLALSRQNRATEWVLLICQKMGTLLQVSKVG